MNLSQFPRTTHLGPRLAEYAYEKTWVDRILDVILGEDSSSSKYALICEICHSHNGLCHPDEYQLIGMTATILRTNLFL